VKIKLEKILRCDDQSALIHNFVANADAGVRAWANHSGPRSPLGSVSFLEVIGSEVLTMVRGEVYTRGARRQLIEHDLTRHEWLPWSYMGQGAQIAVARTVTDNLWIGRVQLRRRPAALLLIELQSTRALGVELDRYGDGLRFRWENRFIVDVSFAPRPAALELSDDPSPLKQQFLGTPGVQLNDSGLRRSGRTTGACG